MRAVLLDACVGLRLGCERLCKIKTGVFVVEAEGLHRHVYTARLYRNMVALWL